MISGILYGEVIPLILFFAFDAMNLKWPSRWHPVAWLGRGAGFVETRLHAPLASPTHQLLAGALLVGLVVGGALVSIRLMRTLMVVPVLQIVFDAFILCACCTMSGLLGAAKDVRRSLLENNISDAREGLRSLCSRDPSDLDAEEVAAAAIESVAENTSDSWIAPLFWYVLLGQSGMVVYRSVNTLDAMYGYRGEREWFGKVAARLDDALNLIPSRLTALLLWWRGPRSRRAVAWQIFVRDRGKTMSPNAGQPMAMMSGLLGICLTKRGCYCLGDAERPVTVECLAQAMEIARWAGAAGAGATILLEILI
ncbi:MAG: adenosylcobinamide-phosphate synthase CbiB [Myxococcales bacterium]|nr:adenosylcobinamide-phosphate synthase CbiB [Myxococcales bacterium]